MNISKAEWEVFRELVILRADKGKATVLLSRSDYHTKVERLLEDPSSKGPTGRMKDRLVP